MPKTKSSEKIFKEYRDTNERKKKKIERLKCKNVKRNLEMGFVVAGNPSDPVAEIETLMIKKLRELLEGKEKNAVGVKQALEFLKLRSPKYRSEASRVFTPDDYAEVMKGATSAVGTGRKKIVTYEEAKGVPEKISEENPKKIPEVAKNSSEENPKINAGTLQVIAPQIVIDYQQAQATQGVQAHG